MSKVINSTIIGVIVGSILSFTGNWINSKLDHNYRIEDQNNNVIIEQEKTEIPLLRRILNFTYLNSKYDNLSNFKPSEFTKFSKKIIKDDKYGTISKIVNGRFLSISYNIVAPIFVIDSSYKVRFVNDLAYLELNKDKISPSVYNKVEEIQHFIYQHPISELDIPIGEKSEWADSTLVGNWKGKLAELQEVANDRLQGYGIKL